MQNAAAIAEEFADMLGDEPGGTAAPPADAEDGADAAADDAAPPAADSKAEKKARKAEQKRHREGDIIADLVVGTEEAPKKKKQRKQKQAASEGNLNPMAAEDTASEPAGINEPPMLSDNLPAAQQKRQKRKGAKKASVGDGALKVEAAEGDPDLAASRHAEGEAKVDDVPEAAPGGKRKAPKKAVAAPDAAVKGGVGTLASAEDILKSSDTLPGLIKARRNQKGAKKVAGEDSERLAEAAVGAPQSVGAAATQEDSHAEAALPHTGVQLLDVFEDRSRGTSAGKDGGKAKKKKRDGNGKGGWKGMSKGAGKAKKRKSK